MNFLKREVTILKRTLSSLLAVVMLVSLSVEAFAAKPSGNPSVSSKGDYIRIFEGDYTGTEVTPGTGNKIYTGVWYKSRFYDKNDKILRTNSAPLGSLYKYSGGSWVAAKDNIDYPSNYDFKVDSGRTSYQFVKPGKYREERGYYDGTAHSATIEYTVEEYVPDIHITSVSLSPTSKTMYVGQSLNIYSTIYPSNTTDSKTLSWSLTNINGKTPGTLTKYSSYATFKASVSGTTTLKVTTSNGKTATCVITILEPTITATPDSVELKAGETVKVTAKTEPSTIQSSVVSSSNNSNLETKYNTSTGKVEITAKDTDESHAGFAATVTVSAGGASDTVNVVVKPSLQDIIVTPDSLDMILGEIDNITVTKKPTTVTEDVEFNSGDSTIATVDKDGEVQAVGIGNTVIKVTCGEIVKEVPVTVSKKLNDLQFTGSKVELIVGESKDSPATKVPSDAPGEITYISKDPDIATVDNEGTITGVAPGTTTVTATCNDKKAEIEVVVSAKLEDIKVVPGLLPPSGIVTITPGDKLVLEVQKVPENAGGKIEFEVKDPEIADVDPDGTVTGKKDGETSVIIKCEEIIKEVPIKVEKQEHKITIKYIYEDGTTASEDVVKSLKEGETYVIDSPTIPNYTADKPVVSGTMGSLDREVVVTYTKNPSKPENPDKPTNPDKPVYDPNERESAGVAVDIKIEAAKSAIMNYNCIYDNKLIPDDIEFTLAYEGVTWNVKYPTFGGKLTIDKLPYGNYTLKTVYKGKEFVFNITIDDTYKLTENVFKDLDLGKSSGTEQPGGPDTPDDPNKPGNPDDPNKPGTPDDPNKPTNPDDPNTPSNPGDDDDDKPNKPSGTPGGGGGGGWFNPDDPDDDDEGPTGTPNIPSRPITTDNRVPGIPGVPVTPNTDDNPPTDEPESIIDKIIDIFTEPETPNNPENPDDRETEIIGEEDTPLTDGGNSDKNEHHRKLHTCPWFYIAVALVVLNILFIIVRGLTKEDDEDEEDKKKKQKNDEKE